MNVEMALEQGAPVIERAGELPAVSLGDELCDGEICRIDKLEDVNEAVPGKPVAKAG